MTMAAGTVLTTDNMQPQEAALAWRHWMASLFDGLESDLYGANHFEGHLHTAHAGDVVLTRLDASRHRVLRSQRAARAGHARYLKIVAPWQGSALVQQHGRQALVRPGGWAIYDTSGSYEVANPERSRHLIVMLPQSQLAERGLRLESLMGRQVGGGVGISRVALDTMRSTFAELPSMTPEAARGAGRLIGELVCLSLQELAGQAPAATLQQAFKDRIHAYVAQHLQDPALSIERIAQGLNCSKRHLHNAFADADETLAEHILRRRLQACMNEMRNPACRHRTISEIAFAWGFSSGAYFSRVFRAQVGVSPTEFRG
jgi:AraC-like DNA-binding protein